MWDARLPSPFESARVKFLRARHHINDLKAQIEDFFKSGSIYVALELADEYSNAIGLQTAAFVYRQKLPLPAAWSAIIGDAIHNLRSALDLIVCDIYRNTGGRPEELVYVQYPFCKTSGDLRNTIKSRRLSHIGSKYIRLIEETAPYPGGNKGLRAVHDLDILDKHQSLIPTISIIQLDWPVPVKDHSKFVTGITHDGQRLMIFPKDFAKNIPINSQIKADFSIVFGDVGVFRGCEVIGQLEVCQNGIDAIIQRFESLQDETTSG